MRFWLLALLLCLPAWAEASKKSAAFASYASYEAALSSGFAALHRDDLSGAAAAWRFAFTFDRPENRALWPRFADLCEQSGHGEWRASAARDWARVTRNALPAAVLAALPESGAKEAKAAMSGFVTDWRVAGPFDNSEGTGFERAFAPEGNSNLSSVYKGRSGQPLRWHTPRTARAGLCFVSRFLGDDAPGVFYAATAFTVTAPTKVRLSFNYGGALKAWLNGTAIVADSRYRPLQTHDPDLLSVNVTLPAGTSSLLLKIADDETSEAAFSLRATPSPTAVLTADATRFKFQTLGGTAPPLPAFDVITALKTLPVTSERIALLGSAYAAAGNNETAAQSINEYLLRNPLSVRWLYEEMAGAQDAYDPAAANASRQLGLQTGPEGEAKTKQPENTLSRLALCNQQPSLTTRLSLLAELAKSNPQSSQAAWALAKTYGRVGQKEPALEAARRAVELAPGAPNQAALVEFLNNAGRRYEAGKTLERALKKYPASAALWRLAAERALAQNERSEAIAAWRNVYATDETQSGVLRNIAALQERLGAVQGALATRKAVRALRPQDADAARQLSVALRRNGDKNGAISMLREALKLDPSQVAWREELWLLAGDKSVFEIVQGLTVPELAKLQVAKPPAVKPPAKAEKTKVERTKVEKNARTQILLDEARQVLFADRAALTRYHQVIKIGDAAGVARYRKFMLVLPGSARVTLEYLRIVRNGKARDFTSDFVSDAVPSNVIALPSLTIGDIVDLAYRAEVAPPGEARNFSSQWAFSVAGTPVKTSRFVLIAPPEVSVVFRSSGDIPAPRVDDIRSGAAAWRVREWRLNNVPGDSALLLDVESSLTGNLARP